MKNTFRNLARCFGGLALLFYLGGFVLGAFSPPDPEMNPDPDPEAMQELYPMLAMLFITLCAYIFTWIPEKKGDLIGGSVIILLSFCMGGYILILRGWEKWSFGLAYCLPFLIPGVLFLVAWSLQRKTKSEQN